tara:strand:- start:345 stop:611 length:267 start_codon:yes stop_codon:yes gene_type:complete
MEENSGFGDKCNVLFRVVLIPYSLKANCTLRFAAVEYTVCQYCRIPLLIFLHCIRALGVPEDFAWLPFIINSGVPGHQSINGCLSFNM